MASWRDQLQAAEFRNVKFFVEAAEMAGGRKTIVFDLPGRDLPRVQDWGRRIRQHRVEAYVLGQDYFAQRAALMEALEYKGPSVLTHPYLGQKWVSVQGFTFQEAREQGGIARFNIEFIEHDASSSAPVSLSAPQDLYKRSSVGMIAAAQDRFVSRYLTHLPTGPSLPGFSLKSVTQVLKDWTGALRGALTPVIHVTQTLSTMKSQLDAIVASASELVRTPLVLVEQLGQVAQSLLDWPDTPRLGIGALMAAYGFHTTAVRPSATTRSRAGEQRNYDELSDFVRTLSVTQAGTFAIRALPSSAGRPISIASRVTDVVSPSGYDSYNDAVRVRDSILRAIDTLSETADDASFAALMQIRADLAAAVPGDPDTLARLRSITPAVTVPALVLGQRLYGDLRLVDDLITRNHIAHPGFVPGGLPIEVRSHA